MLSTEIDCFTNKSFLGLLDSPPSSISGGMNSSFNVFPSTSGEGIVVPGRGLNTVGELREATIQRLKKRGLISSEDGVRALKKQTTKGLCVLDDDDLLSDVVTSDDVVTADIFSAAVAEPDRSAHIPAAHEAESPPEVGTTVVKSIEGREIAALRSSPAEPGKGSVAGSEAQESSPAPQPISVRIHTAETAVRGQPRQISLPHSATLLDLKVAAARALGVHFVPDVPPGTALEEEPAPVPMVKLTISISPGAPNLTVEAPSRGCTVAALKSIISAATGEGHVFFPSSTRWGH